MIEIGLQGKIATFRFVDLCVYDLYRPNSILFRLLLTSVNQHPPSLVPHSHKTMNVLWKQKTTEGLLLSYPSK